MYRADFIAEVVPGLVLVAATYIAAVPAFRTMRQASRGRARDAMAWLNRYERLWAVSLDRLAALVEEDGGR